MLYRHKDHPGHWIAEDHGALMIWPAEPKGWTRRHAYTGSKRGFEEVPPAMARGTGWPGAGRGPAPRAGVAAGTTGLRATDAERARWKQAADKRGQPFASWARDMLNSEADRVLGPGDVKPRPKKP